MPHPPPHAEPAGRRLARETSPYLRQHARNPVEWFPWGEEALARARQLDRPILLSIGYSACHWCHVMERESFEDPEIAALMNEHFVSIKVDREERPDLDAIYMNAVQLLTGSGGWPLTVFLTPEGRPFFGGTYFPPEDRHGRPGFRRVLSAIARAYREGASEVGRNVDALARALDQLSRFEPAADGPSGALVAEAEARLLALADPEHGGFGGAPKFPCPSALSLLLRRHLATGRPEPLDALRRALDAMARGGVYDHLGGGFHRYSVDAGWLVPHFEKMLYDNALLARLYLDAFAATGEPRYRSVALETLGYLLRDMRHPAGGFFSSQDADTEGVEGATYLWRRDEVHALLDPAAADLFCRAYAVSEPGSFTPPGTNESRCILHRTASSEELARLVSGDAAEVERELDAARRTLLEARRRRPQPERDEKVLASWNALAIRALVRAANVLGDDSFLDAARETAAFLDRELALGDGRLLRSWRDGDARHAGCLDDHAFLAAATLDLFEATGERAFLDRADQLAAILVDRFADREAGGFFFTADDHERLVDRPKIVFDASLPSGNAVATEVLLRLAALTGRADLREVAERTLRLFGERMRADPFGTAALVSALDDLLAEPLEIVIAGERSDAETLALLAAAHGAPASARSVLLTPPATPEDERVEAARGKGLVGGRPAAYVCRSMRCSEPVSRPDELRDALAAPAAGGPA